MLCIGDVHQTFMKQSGNQNNTEKIRTCFTLKCDHGKFEQLEALKSNNIAFYSVNAVNELRRKHLIIATDFVMVSFDAIFLQGQTDCLIVKQNSR